MAGQQVHRMSVGNVEIVSMPDGAANLGSPPPAYVGESREARPDFAMYHRRFPDAFHGPDHHWRIYNGCYLLRSSGRTLLVDTGVGPWPYRRYGGIEGTLMGSFAGAGVALEDVDTVFMTHAHPDHVGWNVTPEGRPAFPRARYVVHEADWAEFARRDPPPNYVGRSLAPLERLGALDLLPGEAALTPEVTAIETPGHTPGHMSLVITSNGEHAVIGGDVFCHPLYITEPEAVFSPDADHPQAAATRSALLDRIEAEGMRLVAGHHAEPGFGEVVRVDGRRWWRAL